MRPEDILKPTPAGLCCQIGGFHIDPMRPVEQGADHARPFRSRARRPRRGAGDAGNARHDAPALRRELRRLDAGDRATARRCELGGVEVSFHPAGHVLGSAQICVARERHARRRVGRLQGRRRTRPARRSSSMPCDVFITEATFGLPVFRHGDPRRRDRQAAALGRAVSRARASRRRLFARQGAARDRADPRGRLRQADLPARRDGEHHALLRRARDRSRRAARRCATPTKAELAGAIALCPPSSLQDRWTRRFPDPVSAFASGWMRVRARARQRGVELPLVISDHADWDGLTATIAATGASQIWVTHGAEEALVHWCTLRGLEARPLGMVGYGDEDEGDGRASRAGGRGMNRFAALLDRLAYEPSRNAKLRLLTDYFRDDARPGSRLRARGDHRRALVPPRQARHHPRADRRAHRPDAVRTVLRLCRRPVGDGRADVAGLPPRRRQRPSPLAGEGRGGGSR